MLLIKRGNEGLVEEIRKEDSLWYGVGVHCKRLRGRKSLSQQLCTTAGAFVFLPKSDSS